MVEALLVWVCIAAWLVEVACRLAYSLALVEVHSWHLALAYTAALEVLACRLAWLVEVAYKLA